MGMFWSVTYKLHCSQQPHQQIALHVPSTCWRDHPVCYRFTCATHFYKFHKDHFNFIYCLLSFYKTEYNYLNNNARNVQLLIFNSEIKSCMQGNVIRIHLNCLYCCTVHLVHSLIITQPTNALIVCHLFLNHFFKTLSLLLHISIAYRLSSSGST